VNLPIGALDPRTLKVLTRLCNEVWVEASRLSTSALNEADVREQIARKIMSAVLCGENDPERLKAWALHSLA
jgi:hypothetical protein